MAPRRQRPGPVGQGWPDIPLQPARADSRERAEAFLGAVRAGLLISWIVIGAFFFCVFFVVKHRHGEAVSVAGTWLVGDGLLSVLLYRGVARASRPEGPSR